MPPINNYIRCVCDVEFQSTCWFSNQFTSHFPFLSLVGSKIDAIGCCIMFYAIRFVENRLRKFRVRYMTNWQSVTKARLMTNNQLSGSTATPRHAMQRAMCSYSCRLSSDDSFYYICLYGLVDAHFCSGSQLHIANIRGTTDDEINFNRINSNSCSLCVRLASPLVCCCVCALEWSCQALDDRWLVPQHKQSTVCVCANQQDGTHSTASKYVFMNTHKRMQHAWVTLVWRRGETGSSFSSTCSFTSERVHRTQGRARVSAGS